MSKRFLSLGAQKAVDFTQKAYKNRPRETFSRLLRAFCFFRSFFAQMQTFFTYAFFASITKIKKRHFFDQMPLQIDIFLVYYLGGKIILPLFVRKQPKKGVVFL